MSSSSERKSDSKQPAPATKFGATTAYSSAGALERASERLGRTPHLKCTRFEHGVPVGGSIVK